MRAFDIYRPSPSPRLSIDTLAFPHIPMIYERPYKIRGDICIGFASIFSYVLPAFPRLATPTPSQLCGSHAAHLRTRQCSRLKSSFAPYLIFYSLKVGQTSTSSVPRGIAMVFMCHASRLLLKRTDIALSRLS